VTVAVELDHDPPRLRRADGLVVQFPRDADGSFPVMEVGWRSTAVDFELLFRWCGFPYQELQPGDAAALLVGHIPKGGYSSAVVKLDDHGVELEFADRIPTRDGEQTLVAETMIHGGVLLDTSLADDIRIEEEVQEAGALIHRRIRLSRPAAAAPFMHRHHVVIDGKPTK